MTDTERAKICGNCVYWREIAEGRGQGQCRRYSPRTMQHAQSYETAFPITGTADWCGEFAMRKEAGHAG